MPSHHAIALVAGSGVLLAMWSMTAAAEMVVRRYELHPLDGDPASARSGSPHAGRGG